jgi:hypothetical protein
MKQGLYLRASKIIRSYLGAGFIPLPMEVLGLGVPDRWDPL